MTMPPGEHTVCPIDKTPNVICGGPHYEVETNLGVEVLRTDQKPLGKLISEMSKKERKEHEKAVAQAGGVSPEAVNRAMIRRGDRVRRTK